MSATREQLEHLGNHVRRRRDEMGKTQIEVTSMGGPSNTTLTKVENAVEEPSRKTLGKLDEGLLWEPGSARRVLYDLGEPKPAYRAPESSGDAIEKAIDASTDLTPPSKRELKSHYFTLLNEDERRRTG